ncbi:hypothetical protein HDV00_002625 [Rhizophlyctis rosea]|nr:hypothetical protein HDV00_002625 [Rhizophlyctis rosea]
MGQRTHPLSLRLRMLINWPSNVRHPFLAKYIKHIFQQHLIGEPGIRASTTGIWVNVTVLDQLGNQPVKNHPRVQEPVLNLRDYKLSDALGRFEKRGKTLATASNLYYRDVFRDVPYKSLAEALAAPDPVTGKPQGGAGTGTLAALHIYKDVPVHLKVNIIKNPLLNAQVLADYIAKTMSEGRPLSRIHKQLLSKMQ